MKMTELLPLKCINSPKKLMIVLQKLVIVLQYLEHFSLSLSLSLYLSLSLSLSLSHFCFYYYYNFFLLFFDLNEQNVLIIDKIHHDKDFIACSVTAC